MSSPFIIEVHEGNFEQQVLSYSHTKPVLVDFWADWCAPCKQLTPILEKLAIEAQGSFVLAKLDVDTNQNLSTRYQITSVPTVMAFRNGQAIDRFSGLMPENSIRAFINRNAPSQHDLQLEKGFSLMNMGNFGQAKTSFEEVLEDEPGSPSALFGLARCQIVDGEFEEALENLLDFPASKYTKDVEQMLVLINEVMNFSPDSEVEDDLSPAFEQSIRLIKLGNISAALDGLLEILRQDKSYRDGKAKELILALLLALGDENPETRNYRSELASILF